MLYNKGIKLKTFSRKKLYATHIVLARDFNFIYCFQFKSNEFIKQT